VIGYRPATAEDFIFVGLPIRRDMLDTAIKHVQGLGRGSRAKLLDAGVRTWDDILSWKGEPPIGLATWQHLLEWTDEAVRRYDARDWVWLGRELPMSEHWRVWPELADEALFLDIETTGLSRSAEVSVVGTWDGKGEPHVFVAGQDLDDFVDVVGSKTLLVTFYGSGFDVPFLRDRYPDARFPPFHIDLCFLLRRLGLGGGLKSIEHQLGVQRSDETDGLSGRDAVRLWYAHKKGDPHALDTLVKYNIEDLRNLLPLLEHGVRELGAQERRLTS
jgi:hypothetical protein